MIVPPTCSCPRPISLLEVIAGVILILFTLAVYHRPELLNAIPLSVGRALSLVIFFFVVILVYYLPRYGGVNK